MCVLEWQGSRNPFYMSSVRCFETETVFYWNWLVTTSEYRNNSFTCTITAWGLAYRSSLDHHAAVNDCIAEIDLHYGAAILIFNHSNQCNQNEAGRRNSLVPFCLMNISINYCCWIQGTWPRWWQHDKGLLLLGLIFLQGTSKVAL